MLSAGANGKVSPADVNNASFLDHSLLLLQLEIPTPTVLSAMKRATEKGIRVILNPAPAKKLPDELIALADYIIPNETELSLLTGIEVKDLESAKKAAQSLLERGAQNVIVTLGERGALIVTGASAQATHVDTYKVNVVDTTAAGDAFIGGFGVKLIESSMRSLTPIDSQNLEEAVHYGCACGALATTKFGAQPSLPTKEEVERFMS